MSPFPPVTSEAEFDAFVDDAAAVDALLRHVQDTLGLAGPLVRPERGSAVVALGSDEVIKVMAPHDAALSRIEEACLRGLEGRLPIPTPRCLQAGELQGWRFIRMSRLGGHELAEVWPRLDPPARLGLATQLGETLAVLRGLPAPAEVPRLDWDAWTAARLGALVDAQRAKGCPEALLDGLTPWVEGADLQAGTLAWLHTEIMREHLLVTETPAGWRLTGLFDFEPSWVGPADYELASVGLFVSGGEPEVLREVMRAAGVQVDPRRLFAMAMMHRYANLGWYYKRLGGPLDLEALTERWFGCG